MPDALAFCLRAFWDLHGSRAQVPTAAGMVSSPIAYRDISAWAHDHGLEPDVRDGLVTVIRELDAEWFAHEAEERRRAAPPAAGKGAPAPGGKTTRPRAARRRT